MLTLARALLDNNILGSTGIGFKDVRIRLTGFGSCGCGCGCDGCCCCGGGCCGLLAGCINWDTVASMSMVLKNGSSEIMLDESDWFEHDILTGCGI